MHVAASLSPARRKHRCARAFLELLPAGEVGGHTSKMSRNEPFFLILKGVDPRMCQHRHGTAPGKINFLKCDDSTRPEMSCDLGQCVGWIAREHQNHAADDGVERLLECHFARASREKLSIRQLKI